MPVTARGTSWQAQVSHKGSRYRRLFPTHRAALAWEADSKGKLLRGELPDLGDRAHQVAVSDTLGGLVEHVYATHWKPQNGGAKQYANARAIVGLIGSTMAVEKLTRQDIDKARAKLLAGGNSQSTVNRKVAALSKALSIYGDDHAGYVRPKCAKYDEAEHRIRRFSAAEEDTALDLFERLGAPDMADYVALSLDTGARQGELLKARFRDCDDRLLKLWGTGTKSKRTRSVPLTARAKEIVERRREATKSPAAPLLGTLSVREIQTLWNRLRKVLHLEDDAEFVPHILRHEFCSRLADQDINASVIQALAGHSSLAVTQRYVTVRAESLVAAITRLGGREIDLVPSPPSGMERGTNPATLPPPRDYTPRRKQQDQALSGQVEAA